jgi:hypothetical protein
MIRELELSYVVAKNPGAITEYLIKLWKKQQGISEYSAAQGLLHGGFVFDLRNVGMSLSKKNRKILFKTSSLLIKKSFSMFMLGFDYIVVFKLGGNYKTVFDKKKRNVAKGMKGKGANKLFTTDLQTLFTAYGITKTGKEAFFQFAAKLDAHNKMLMKKTGRALGVAPVLLDGSIPYILLKNIPFPSKEEEEKGEEVVETKEDVKVGKFKFKKLNVKLHEIKPVTDYVKEMDLKLPSQEYGKKASEIKDNVASSIAKPLSQIFGIKEVYTPPEGTPKKNLWMHEEKKLYAKDTAYGIANQSIASWASSSSSGKALHLQKAAMKMFGLTKISGWMDMKLNKMGTSPSVKYNMVMCKVIYEKTQQLLKERGIKELTLFRGMDDMKVDAQISVQNVRMNPLSSFSTSYDTANGFGDYLLVARVPASRIFSCALTGHGCWGEDEYLVLGGEIKVLVINTVSHSAPMDNRIDKLENDVSYVEDKILELLYKSDTKNLSDQKQKKLDATVKMLQEKKKAINAEIKALESKIFKVNSIGQINNALKKLKGELAATEGEGIDEPVPSSPSEPSSSSEPTNEPGGDKMLEESPEDSDWIKYELDTGSLPLIGTKAFEQYVANSGKTIDQIMKMPAYRKAHIKFAPVVLWLRKMASTYDKERAKIAVPPIAVVKTSLCHLATLDGIRERHNMRDKIWFFGDNDGKHPHVFHSLLTNYHNKVVANNFQGVGSSHMLFDPKKGYKTPAGEYIPILDVVPVKEFFDKFLT